MSRKVAPEIVGVVVGVVAGVLSWWLFETNLTEFVALTSVVTVLSPIVGLAIGVNTRELSKLRQDIALVLNDIKGKSKELEFFETLHLEDDSYVDHSIPRVGTTLTSWIEKSFETLMRAKEETEDDQAFFNHLTEQVERMQDTDHLLAVCGRKFWSPQSEHLLNRYWEANIKKAAEGALIMRAFVSDRVRKNDGEFSPEMCQAMEKHMESITKTFQTDTDSARRNVKLRVVRAASRDSVKTKTWFDPKFGFALISISDKKVVSLHRLVDGHLKGLLIEDPLVYAVFESQFWTIWKVGEDFLVFTNSTQKTRQR